MIELKVEDYCHNCPDFDPECKKACSFGMAYSTTVTCAYADRCRHIAEHIKTAVNNKEGPIKSDELCRSCAYSWDHHCKEFYEDNGGCKGCPRWDSGAIAMCQCLDLNDGDPCPYYKEYKNDDT